MKSIFFALSVLGLVACHTATPLPAPYPDSSPPALTTQREYRAVGTEPFWDLAIGHDLVFNDRGTGVTTVEQAPPPIRSAGSESYRGGQIEVKIVHRPCSDGMSDRTYPDQVQVSVDGRAYRGCGADVALFDSSKGS